MRKSIRAREGDAAVKSLLSREEVAPTSLSEADVSTDSGYQQRTGSYIPDTSLLLYYLAALVLFALTWWGLKFEEGRKVSPVLKQLQALQKQLRDI